MSPSTAYSFSQGPGLATGHWPGFPDRRSEALTRMRRQKSGSLAELPPKYHLCQQRAYRHQEPWTRAEPVWRASTEKGRHTQKATVPGGVAEGQADTERQGKRQEQRKKRRLGKRVAKIQEEKHRIGETCCQSEHRKDGEEVEQRTEREALSTE